MPRQDEIRNLLRVILETRDHSDPAAWRAAMTRILDADQPTTLFDAQPVPSGVQGFLQLYADWKRWVALRFVPQGEAFASRFWTDLADPQRRQFPVIGPAGAANPQCFQALLEVASPGVVFFFQSDDFANNCVFSLMCEAVQQFQRRELTEAEELNDAGFAHHHSGGYEQAIPLHDRAIELSPKFSLAWINKGIALKNLGRLDESIACYDHVIREIDPQYKKAWYNKGNALKLKGDLRQALECFEKAAEIDPDYTMAVTQAKQCLVELPQGAPDPDSDDIRSIVESDAQAAQLMTIALKFQEAGQWLPAAQIWEQLYARCRHARILVAWGESLFEAGQMESALRILQQAVEENPQGPWGWILLSRCYLSGRAFDEALAATARAVELGPQISMAWANRASAFCALERFREAAEAAERSVKLDDRNPIGLYYLGVALWRTGRGNEARPPLQRLLRVHPEHPVATSAREILAFLDRHER